LPDRTLPTLRIVDTWICLGRVLGVTKGSAIYHIRIWYICEIYKYQKRFVRRLRKFKI